MEIQNGGNLKGAGGRNIRIIFAGTGGEKANGGRKE